MNENEIRRYLNVIKRAVNLIENMLSDDGGLMEQIAQTVPMTPTVSPPIAPITMQVTTSEAEKQIRQKYIENITNIENWPEAVSPFLAKSNTSDEDQQARANMVLDMMIDRNIEGRKFLDFGCGEGWITKEILKRGASESIGYDINISKNWNQSQFTNNWDKIKRNYFDFVILYDVLDHCLDPIDVMAKVKSCLKPQGVVYVRCHPWTAKHATHLYKQGINKAYFHLFLAWEEIDSLIVEKPIFTRNERDPLTAYYWWFKDFVILKERLVKEPVSDFFMTPAMKDLIMNEQRIDEIDLFLERLQIQFCDFCLTLRQS